MRSLRGFTILELLVVVTLIGVASAFAIPKTITAVNHEQTRAARRAVASQLARAKGTAAQRGCATTLQIRASSAVAYVRSCKVSGAGVDTILPISYLGADHGVTMRSTADSLVISPTTIGQGASNIRISFTRSGYTSWLVISPVGRATW